MNQKEDVDAHRDAARPRRPSPPLLCSRDGGIGGCRRRGSGGGDGGAAVVEDPTTAARGREGDYRRR
jgi:hypothetical protein